MVINSVRGPEAVTAWRSAFAKPEYGVVVQILFLADPPSLAEVVAGWATDRVVLAAPADFGEKLGDYEPIWGLLDMLAERPPTEVIDLLDVLIRTLESRHVVNHPVRRGFVRDGLSEMGVVLTVERFDIVPQRISFQNGR